MDHILANAKKYLGYKKLQGGKKPIRKTEKKVATFNLFFVVLETAKNQQGAPNGNVTPLGTGPGIPVGS